MGEQQTDSQHWGINDDTPQNQIPESKIKWQVTQQETKHFCSANHCTSLESTAFILLVFGTAIALEGLGVKVLLWGRRDLIGSDLQLQIKWVLSYKLFNMTLPAL